MKTYLNQRWILSTLLITALGSQYYFSASSKSIGAVEMASTQESQIKNLINILDNKAVKRESSVVESWKELATTQTTPQNMTKLTKTEAAPSCNDCVEVSFSREEYDRLKKTLTEMAEKPGALKEIQTAKATDTEDKTTDPDETESEKRRRLRREKLEAKREQKLTKKEKEKDAQEERDDAFEEKFEELSENCSESGRDDESALECYASSLGSALSRYTGSKKNRVNDSVVRKIYNEHISRELKEALTDPENPSAVSALENLMADIPGEYRSIKANAIKHARDASAQVATQANSEFKLAEEYRRANRMKESTQMFASAMNHKTNLEGMLQSHDVAISSGTLSAEDNISMKLYKTGYAKEAMQWVSNIMNTTGFSTDGTSNTVQTLPSRQETAHLRGGTTVNHHSAVNPNANLANPTFVPNQPNTNQSLGQPQGTQIGTPGGRGRRGG